MAKDAFARKKELESKGMNDFSASSQLMREGYNLREIASDFSESDAQRQFQSSPGYNNFQNMGKMRPSMNVFPQEQEEYQYEEQQEEVPMPGQEQGEQEIPEQEYEQTEGQSYPYQYENTDYNQSYQSPQKDYTTETVEELIEEVVNEKWETFKLEIGDIPQLKKEMSSRIDHLNERIKRLEIALDRLQSIMIGKVREYGQGINSIGGEVQVLQKAFSQILNPLVDNVKELNNLTDKLKAISGKKNISPQIPKLKKISEKKMISRKKSKK